MKDLKESQIAELGLFRGCSRTDIKWIAAVADTVDVSDGSVLVSEGHKAMEFVVLMRGGATAFDGDGAVTLARGAYFGEMSLIDGRPNTRTVVTLGKTRVLVFGAGAFRGMLDRIPSVARKLMAEMVSELREVRQAPRSLRAVS